MERVNTAPGYFNTFDFKGSSCDSLYDSEDFSRSGDTSSEDLDVSSELDITCALLPTALPSGIGIDTADISGVTTEGVAPVAPVPDKRCRSALNAFLRHVRYTGPPVAISWNPDYERLLGGFPSHCAKH